MQEESHAERVGADSCGGRQRGGGGGEQISDTGKKGALIKLEAETREKEKKGGPGGVAGVSLIYLLTLPSSFGLSLK